MSRLLLAATWLLVAWGALAFGAVYPWAWRPLVTGCAVVGVASLIAARRRGGRASDGGLLCTLAVLAALALFQVVPLPRDARLAISPASEAVWLEQDLEYASVQRQGDPVDAVASGTPQRLPDRPLSIDPAATVRAVILLAGMTVLLAGLTRLLNVTGARRLATALAGLGLALALIGIIQRALLGDHAFAGMKIYGFWQPKNLLTTPFGPFVNKNHFAGWMLMCLPLVMGLGLGWAERSRARARQGWRDALLWLSSPDGGKVQMAMLAVLVMAVSLMMTRSRSGIAGFVAAMLVAGVAVWRRFGGVRVRLAGVAVILSFVVVAFAWAGRDIGDRFSTSGGSLDLRRRVWNDSLNVLRQFPLVGTGLNTFSRAMLSYQSPPRDPHFQEAHNDYLQVMAEGGIVLALPAAVAVALLAAGIRRRFASGRDDPMAYWLRMGATTGLVAIALQSLVEFSLQMPGNAVLCTVLMAIALHQAPERSESRPGRRQQFS